jgi:hypothetical protein
MTIIHEEHSEAHKMNGLVAVVVFELGDDFSSSSSSSLKNTLNQLLFI